MATELEARLVRLRDTTGPSAEATARARTAALQSLPPARGRRAWWHPGPPRRMLSAALTGAGLVAIAAVLVLALPRGEAPPASAAITLVATSPAPGGVVDAAGLEVAADMIDRRAELMGIAGADARVADSDIVLRLPADAPPGALSDLTAPGEFAIYDPALIIGPEGGTRALPTPGPGQRVIEVEVMNAQTGRADHSLHLLIRNQPALTNRDIASATVAVDPADQGEPIIRATLTDDGRRAWKDLSRRLAQRGAIDGDRKGALVVIEGRLVSAPVIDPERHPDGINSGGLSITITAGAGESALRAIAARMQEGPLPVVLTPAG